MEGTAAVVGSGPNGLGAAVVLARAGLEVTVFEAAPSPGGAARSSDLLGPGTVVDLGSAVHPFGAASPLFSRLGLHRHGLEWLHPPVVAAHPLDDGPPGLLHRSLERTAEELGPDGRAWSALHRGVVERWEETVESVLGPLVRPPAHPLALAGFGLRAPWPAAATARALFRTEQARGLFAGSAAHSVLPARHVLTSAFGTLFGAAAHATGWPVARGGSQAIVDALVADLREHGGRVVAGTPVTDLDQVRPADVVLLDLTPRQVLGLRGLELPARYRRALARWRYGTASYKVDLLLDGPVPWRDPRVGRAGTVHVGGTLAQIDAAESEARAGRVPERPFVLVAQQGAADPSRAPEGRQVLWAYAHVPHGCDDPVAGERVLAQIERFAPGLRDRVLARVDTPPSRLEAWNANLVGGDIGGGALDGLQQVFRPAVRADPYATGAPGVWLCSSSTPPGGGVHGMAGDHAARSALRDLARRRRSGG
ncbi:FAD-dependent oxidoreductase [Kocuria dechangensis]|uniref:FAD-dependent oxidoreductase n=1 Tax=Kocuria dechangensis TaxID=1176249 RepID=A0A917H1G1_9MICC|nr:NAD(P)/FAD-dependent oxidoreductase [Kocuria dechangensis]GGG63785.1 FAD-dependent oxidoreductase [Kocuria dechangensis]